MGATRHGEAMAGHLALALSQLTGRAVDWRVTAKAGATPATARRALLGGLTDPMTRWRPDLVLIVAGTNGAVRMRRRAPSAGTRRRWCGTSGYASARTSPWCSRACRS
ncbi:hypothetical protein [Streptomyces sp. enrichment culture]|uniref:hypothetical protein n=1 Tax=Streptomyces sp. enrichment culture TaxID=1795815 RepID=UPI003F5521D8